ncbi:hypothetical protein Tsp_05560 [Trichinella spiralis]|uniref:hypothetical protein n=1 Tax=Trichinella spiralis TaxID=6334 RepID=UPI0001EFDF7E|nr:hypothetical protein Tsp_05560 [Trichinella spiralis]
MADDKRKAARNESIVQSRTIYCEHAFEVHNSTNVYCNLRLTRRSLWLIPLMSIILFTSVCSKRSLVDVASVPIKWQHIQPSPSQTLLSAQFYLILRTSWDR